MEHSPSPPLARPDYLGGSIVNLMSSIAAAFGVEPHLYPALRSLDPDRLAGGRDVVLLVVDGLGYRFLRHGDEGATLRHFLEGSMSSVYPPTTATAIPAYLTGLAPQQHGLSGWFTYFKELGSVIAVLPFRARHGGPALGGDGVDPGQLVGGRPLFERVRARSFVVMPEWIARSDFNLAMSAGAQIVSYRTLAELFAALRRILAQGPRGRYVYAYWPELDRLAHEHGIGSEQVSWHLGEIDEAFGRFVDAQRGSGTVLVATADHGFIDSRPEHRIELEDHPALTECLVLPLCGEPRTAYCYVHPERESDFVSYVETALSHAVVLRRSEDLLAEGYFGLGAPHPRLRERLGHYCLVAREDYVLKDWLLGERRYRHVGVHGGSSAEEMEVPLIVAET